MNYPILSSMERYDLCISGGGILGTNLAQWLSALYEGKIVVLEMEQDVARHTSGRNTGVIHRPFYLHPEKRRTFARCANLSYHLWKEYAKLENLPWKEIGTIEVATTQHQVDHIKKYMEWAVQNGMDASEVELLSGDQVKKLEPHVDCLGAIFAKTDTSVDYQLFTESLKKRAAVQGAQFKFGFKVRDIASQNGGLKIKSADGQEIETSFFINCSGGNAIDVAHLMNVGKEYTDLHFRGEYWEISPAKSGLVSRNIYTVPKHPDIPFLDPHWIVRADGRREIGPNAVLIAGSQTYQGFASSFGELLCKIFERPLGNKARLFTNADFLRLASEEWYSSLSKKAMLARVQKFIPELKIEDLVKRGTAGIRSSVIDPKGNFIKEAIELNGEKSFHILNYNSPGATGSPAYTALLVSKLDKLGKLSSLKKRPSQIKGIWDFSQIIETLH